MLTTLNNIDTKYYTAQNVQWKHFRLMDEKAFNLLHEIWQQSPIPLLITSSGSSLEDLPISDS